MLFVISKHETNKGNLVTKILIHKQSIYNKKFETYRL